MTLPVERRSCAASSCTCCRGGFMRIRNFGFLANRRAEQNSFRFCLRFAPSLWSSSRQTPPHPALPIHSLWQMSALRRNHASCRGASPPPNLPPSDLRLKSHPVRRNETHISSLESRSCFARATPVLCPRTCQKCSYGGAISDPPMHRPTLIPLCDQLTENLSTLTRNGQNSHTIKTGLIPIQIP